MKEYTSPRIDYIEFGDDRITTTASRCDCYAEHWNYEEDFNKCSLTSGDYSEIADANSGL